MIIRESGTRRRVAAVVMSALTLALAVGCGSDDESSGASGDTAGNASSEAAASAIEKTGYQLAADSAATDEARAEGESAGQESLGKRPSEKKVAYIHFTAESTSSQRVLAGVQSAADELGFELITCDPAVDAQKFQQCGTAMVSQGPDLILSFLGEAAVFGSSVKEAKARNIPWVNLGTEVSPSPDLLQYVAEAARIQSVENEWLLGQLEGRADGGKAKVLGLGAPSAGRANAIQHEAFVEGMKGASHVELVTAHHLDLANLVQDTLNITRRTLQQHPDLGAIWTVCDLCVPTVEQGASGAEGEGPILTGNFSTPQTAKLIRSGDVAGVVDLAWEVYGWVAMDRALEHWASEEPMADEPLADAYALDFSEPYMLTKDNAGSSGLIPVQGPDFVTYFTTKWQTQFDGE